MPDQSPFAPSAFSFSRRVRRSGVVLLTSGLLLLGTASGVHAQEKQKHATGARPLTPADVAWYAAQAETPKEVRLNKLAVDRINAEREKKACLGCHSRACRSAGRSSPKESARRTPVRRPGQPPAVVPALPIGVDNSLLPSFPPIFDQGSVGSCVCCSTTYYAATQMTGLLRGTNNKGTANTVLFSPKWTHTMINGGGDNGSVAIDAYNFLINNGIATLTDVPYSGDDNPTSYLPWSTEANIWRRALSYRMNQAGTSKLVKDDGSLNTDNLTQLKTLLANGYVVSYATNIFSRWTATRRRTGPSRSRSRRRRLTPRASPPTIISRTVPS